MSPPAASSVAAPPPQGGWRWAAAEVLFLFLMFFVYAGLPPPDVGEAHYLAKAKHYWDPSWCRGDLFLESQDAHGVFYWTFGWVTRLVSLTAAAWLGRSITWLLLAWSWQRLSASVAPLRLMSILTGGLMLLFIRRFHMAGEWIVGGVEAKGFSYVLVLLALEAVVRERWRLAFVLVGGATAFHVLVGGWTSLAIAGAWFVCGRRQVSPLQLAPALTAAAALAAVGIVPALALSRGIDPAIVSEANRIYVFDRLSHHLVFHRFGAIVILRHALLLAAWATLAWWTYRENPGLGRLDAVVLAGVAIGAVGVLIDQGLVALANSQELSKDDYQRLAAPILKYYWFRLSDSLVAIGAALALGRVLVSLISKGLASGSWGIIVAMLAVGANLTQIGYERSRQRLPGSFVQPRPTVDLQVDRSVAEGSSVVTVRPPALSARQQFEYWRDVCRWVKDNTPPDAKVLTPRRQQTFKWYAQRPEVVSWKDVPQDAAGIVAWKQTLTEVFPPGSGQLDLAFHGDEKLVALAREHGASYILIDRTRSTRPIGLLPVYPDLPRHNPAYAVYRVPQAPPP